MNQVLKLFASFLIFINNQIFFDHLLTLFRIVLNFNLSTN